jgi:hypothetical protein
MGRSRSSSVTIVGDVCHVVEEVVDVREEVVIAEGVIGVRDETSSRTKALPKNLIALLPYMTRSCAVLKAYCPERRCTPHSEMGKT